MDVRELKDKATQLFTKGKFAKAAEAYEEYCAADRKDHQSRLRCGDAWSKAGKKDRAIHAYAQAAEGFAKDGFLPRAIAASKLVLEIDPSHKAVQKMLADLYAQKRGPAPAATAARSSTVSGLRPAPAGPEVTRTVESPGTAAGYSKRALDLEMPSAPKPAAAAPARPQAPTASQADRPDAIELPNYELPIETTGAQAATGHRPTERTAALEIDLGPIGATSGPAELAETSIEIELSAGQPVTGEVEIPIEGQSLPEVDQLPVAQQSSAPRVATRIDPLAPPAPSAPIFELTVEADAPAPAAAPAPGVYELSDEVAEPKAAAAAPSAVYDLSDEVPASTPAPAAPPRKPAATPSAVYDLSDEVPASTPAPAAPQQKPAATPSAVYDLSDEVPASAPVAPPRKPTPTPSAVYDLSDEIPEALPEPAPVPRVAAAHASRPPPPPAEEAELPPPSAASPLPPEVAAAPPPPGIAPVKPAEGATLPPGLRPRRAPEPSAAPAAPSSRIWLPPTFAPPAPVETPASASNPASLDLSAEPEAATDLERGLQAFMQFDPDAAPQVAATPAPAPAAAPIAPKAAAQSFTELDLEGDSLLHAVEAAAAAVSVGQPAVTPAHDSVEESMDAPDDHKVEPGAIPKIPLFSDLPEDAFIALFEKCPLQRFDLGQLVFEAGDKADAFYVICGGKTRVFREEDGQRKELATLEEGSFFGELALLSEAPRSASVEAAEDDTQVLVISAEVLRELSTAYPAVATALKKFSRQRMLTNLMNNAPLFAPFNRSDRRELVQKFRARDVARGEVLVREGQGSDGLYVVLYGEVEVVSKGRALATLREGQVFGEMSLLQRTPASATVRATRHTSLLRLPKSDFDTLILSHPQVLEHVAELVDERTKANASAGML